MSEELKPCRRCGLYVSSDGIEVTQTDTGTYTARFECPDCGEVAETCMRHSSEDFAIADLVDDWNRRWVDPALLARLAELEKMAEARKLANCLLEQERNELEAERDRLRKALKEIAKFADSEYEKRIPAPSCVEFSTIKRYAEKALKGAGE